MIKTSSLSLEDGASIESYAHALTMYRLIQPNGSANAFLQKALQQNQSLSPSEQNKLAHLLAQAGKKGEKLKGTPSYSNFNKQHKNLKDKHIKNLKQLHRLKKADDIFSFVPNLKKRTSPQNICKKKADYQKGNQLFFRNCFIKPKFYQLCRKNSLRLKNQCMRPNAFDKRHQALYSLAISS